MTRHEYLVQAGISHQEAPLPALESALRGVSAICNSVTRAVRDGTALREAVVVATCHRLEVYAIGEEAGAAEERLRAAFADAPAANASALPISVRYHRDAARHLCAVTAGLKSLVVGEREIFDQVRAAWRGAVADGTAGPVLASLFRQARRAGRLARSPEAFGDMRESLATIGIAAARQALGSLRDQRALVAGAGRIGRLARELLQREGVATLVLATRRPERLRLREPHLAIHNLTDLPALLRDTDLVIAATAAPEPILTREQVLAAQAHRIGAPLLFVDLGVPRNLDPAIATVSGVRLLYLDDLRPVAASLQPFDEQVIARVTHLAEEAADRFLNWQTARAAAGNGVGRTAPLPVGESQRAGQ